MLQLESLCKRVQGGSQDPLAFLRLLSTLCKSVSQAAQLGPSSNNTATTTQVQVAHLLPWTVTSTQIMKKAVCAWYDCDDAMSSLSELKYRQSRHAGKVA